MTSNRLPSNLPLVAGGLVAAGAYLTTDMWILSIILGGLSMYLAPHALRPKNARDYRRIRSTTRSYLRAVQQSGVGDTVALALAPEQIDDILTGNPQVMNCFVSSTFADLLAERDYLAKVTFPAFSQVCAERGVTWNSIDLRWGITHEQQERKQVLRICLAEIDRARPYFIGLLGDRYGTIIPVGPADVVDNPWIQDHQGESITHLEFVHGGLRSPETALFYFMERPESPTGGDPRLDELKSLIRQSGTRLVDKVSTTQDLGNLVLNALMEQLDLRYPPSRSVDPLVREIGAHAQFARQHGRAHEARTDLHRSIDQRIDSEHVLLLGATGSGKSATVASWARHRRRSRPDEVLVVRYVGAPTSSRRWSRILRGILAEIAMRTASTIRLPADDHALWIASMQLINEVQRTHPVTVVIDGINMLDDAIGKSLGWLSGGTQAHIRILATTVPPLSTDLAYPFSTIEIPELTYAQRCAIVTSVNGERSRRLSPSLVDRIADSRPSGNPQYLRTVLSELHLVQRHQDLDGRLHDCLTNQSLDPLMDFVLDRIMGDFAESDRRTFTNTLRLLATTGLGFTDEQMLRLSAVEGAALTQRDWSFIRVMLGDRLVDVDGVATLDPSFRAAVERRLLADQAIVSETRRVLRKFFSTGSERDADGSAMHLRALAEIDGDWSLLAELMSESTYLVQNFEQDPTLLRTTLGEIQESGAARAIHVIRTAMDGCSEPAPETLLVLAELLTGTGYWRRATPLLDTVIEQARTRNDTAMLARGLRRRACCSLLAGEPRPGLLQAREAMRIEADLRSPEYLLTLNTLGVSFAADGLPDWAIKIFELQVRTAFATGDLQSLGIGTANMAVTAVGMKAPLDFAAILREVGQLATNTLSWSVMAELEGALGQMALAQDNRREAVDRFRRQELFATVVANDGQIDRSLRGQELCGLDENDEEVVRRTRRRQEIALPLEEADRSTGMYILG